ncbi:hypothetical protein MBM09_09525 [Flaviramulus sp. BrNp1-15]|uniref:hypothetical protein n=1 Tax=Flaviramulus sp. BrNp1-15 TaxID=2916754 RepID=UPI001EE79219|nr:hypothetical protein [Flaviramulus sp. BrNp1-15]ULC58157.1 hypothetical protein MBM09_09525 [Flaviramulus sp. BrNp1-15]
MKPYILYFILIFFSLSATAQIDNKKKSIAIPAVESKKDSTDIKLITPSIPNNNNTLGMNKPNVSPNLELPKKEFSMFPKEEFGNPGELYEKQVNRNMDAIKDQMELGTKGSKTDQHFGNVITKSEFANVQYRDFGQEDGDVIRISVNDEIIEYRVTLRNSFKGFKIKLKKGVNRIDFLALNEGYLMPNTAHFRVLDDQGDVLASDAWNLSENVKAIINIIKE